MSKEADNKAIVGRWFTNFWGANCDLAIVGVLAAPDMLLQYSLHEPRRGSAARIDRADDAVHRNDGTAHREWKDRRGNRARRRRDGAPAARPHSRGVADTRDFPIPHESMNREALCRRPAHLVDASTQTHSARVNRI